MTKMPSGLRDNPCALALAVAGVVVVILGLGFLTLKVGSSWAHIYVRQRTQGTAF